MDRGAHFVKVDLQVHTPRDPQWSGHRCSSDQEREEFAREFVAACRTAGLGAVAITDHHDIVMLPWIRRAAREERQADGSAYPKEQRLVVFPGLELTLQVPCQALLIFSEDFPDERLSAVLERLAIEPVDSELATYGDIAQLRFADFQELHDRLDESSWLVGQYIVLPNVSDSGHQTLMRKHFHSRYREMPCVGGYVDGSVSRVGVGLRRKLDGLDPNYGNKRIALLQTSDARSLERLGKNATWVKWAEPTAEAIRQACLAQESRIAHLEPELPSVHVTSLRVSNSRFLGPIDLDFNSQYNALIGGRGTGKSTCLEYLRWGLCDEPSRVSRKDDGTDLHARRQRLIEQTLAPVDGQVEVQFVLNGVPHVVRRYSGDGRLLLKVGDAELAPSTEAEVRGLLPIDAYSQRQLSGVSVRLEELARFVETPIREALQDIDVKSTEAAASIRENFVQLQRQRALVHGIARNELGLASVEQQIRAMREGLMGLSSADREALERRAGHDEADARVKSLLRRLDQARDALEACADTLNQLSPGITVNPAALPETATLAALENKVQDLFGQTEEAVRNVVTSMVTAIESGSEIDRLRREWQEKRIAYVRVYDRAVARSSAHASTLRRLGELEQRRSELQEALDTQREQLKLLGDPAERHDELRAVWRRLQDRRSDLIQGQCDQIGALSDGLIQASVNRGAGTDRHQQRFRSAIQGSGVRTDRVERFLAAVASSEEPLWTWHVAMDALERLVLADSDASGITETANPVLAPFGQGDLERMMGRLTPELILELSLMPLGDQPVFAYRTKEGEQIDFADASAGQQATALLRVLLHEAGPPLVIDQPEDDLDSQVISDVVELIWAAKSNRQLIFVSHNANLVVNGDAELVVCCDYRVVGDYSLGRIKLEGAIDVPAVRDEITQVMEGGERAFRLRKEKYGF